MRAGNLFLGGDLVLKILSQSTNVEKPVIPDDRASQKFFDQISFPAYSQAELRSISTDIASGMKIQDALTKHSFAFPFYLSQLDPLMRSIDKKNIRFTSLFVLYTYLTWIVTFSETEVVDPTASHLLAALASISEVTEFSGVPQLRTLAISAFTDLYMTIVKTRKLEQISEFLSPLYLFFEGSGDLPDGCYSMLSATAKWISEQDQEIGAAMNIFFLFLSKLEPPESCRQELTKIAMTSIQRKSSELYMYLPRFCDTVSKNYLAGFLSMIPSSLIEIIQKGEPITKIALQSPPKELTRLPEANTVEVVLRFQHTDTFRDGLRMEEMVTFPRLLRLQQLIPQWLAPRLSIVAQIASKFGELTKTIVVNFVELLKAGGKNEHIFDQYAMFFYMFRLFPPGLIVELPFEAFFNEVLFDPHITVFEAESIECWDNLNALRFYALETMLTHNSDFIENILESLMVYPLLFTETIHRFIANHELLPEDSRGRITLARSLMSAALYYQSFAGSSNADIEIARTGIYFLISHLFFDHDILILFFGDYTFSYSFLSFVFENPLRDHTLGHLLVYLTKDQAMLNTDMPSIILGIIDMACLSLPETKSAHLVIALFSTINEAMMHKRSLTTMFELLIGSIFRAILQLDNSSDSKVVLDHALQFMTLISNIHTLKTAERDAIERAIKTVYGNEPSQKVFERFVQLLAAEYLASFNPCFHVRQYKVLKTFVSVFSRSDRLIDVLKFIDDLCVYCWDNAVWCNKSVLDLWLIDLIQNAFDDPSLHKFVEPALSLLIRIGQTVSSVTVVHRFIGLLCPVASKVSIFHKQILDALTTMVHRARKATSGYMSMTSDFACTVTGVQGASIDNGFTFICWIKLDKAIPQYKPRILRIKENDEKLVDFFFQSDQVNIEQQTEEYSTVAHIDLRVPDKEWIMLTIKYEPCEGADTTVYTRYDLSKWDLVKIPANRWRPRVPLTMTVGGVTEDSGSPEFPATFTAFGLFSKADDELIHMLWEAGPSADFGMHANCIFQYSPVLNREQLVMQGNAMNAKIHLDYSFPPISRPVPFVDVLIDSCKIDLILPLFQQLPLRTMENARIPHFLDSILAILGSLLSLNKTTQMNFVESNGFGTISHLLMHLPREIIDYSMYTSFYNVLETLAATEIQEQLIDKILMNWEIWNMCDPDNHIRIIKHWHRALCQSFPTQVLAVRSFTDMLTYLRLFYPYNEGSIPRYVTSTSIIECRRIVLAMCASMKIDGHEFLSLIGRIIGCTNTQYIIDLLHLLLTMASQSTAVLADIGEAVNGITLILYILSINDDELRCLVFEVFFVFHKNGYFQECTIQEHVDIMLQQLGSDFLKPSLFVKLMEMMFEKEYYELLSIVSWMAVNLGQTERSALADKLKPSKKYCTRTSWAFWTLVIVVKEIRYEVQNSLIRFVIQSENNTWMNNYIMIDTIGSIFDIPVDELKQQFLHILVFHLMSGEVVVRDEHFRVFFNIAENYILSQTDMNHNEALKAEIDAWQSEQRPKAEKVATRGRRNQRERASSGIFTIKKMPEAQDGKLIRMKSFLKVRSDEYILPHQLPQKLRLVDDNIKPVRFGLRLARDGLWKDATLARNCLQLFSLWNNRKYLKFDLLLCYLLAKHYNAEVAAHIRDLNLSDKEISKYQEWLALITQKLGNDPISVDVPISVASFEKLQKRALKVTSISQQGCIFVLHRLASIREKCEKMLMIDDREVRASAYRVQNLTAALERKRRHNAKVWQRLWGCMTIDKAPWAAYRTDSEINAVPKRDGVLCDGVCPVKLRNTSMSAIVIDYDQYSDELDSSNLVLVETPAEIITPFSCRKASFILKKDAIYVKRTGLSQKVIPFGSVVRILQRTRFQKPTAIEIFVDTGKSIFINFPEYDLSELLNTLKEVMSTAIIQTASFAEFVKNATFTDDWVNGKISNFRYLSILNLLSGRSFCDETQYPIFPWVISDYNSESLDLSNPSTFRDLRTAMIATDKVRLNALITRNLSRHDDSFSLERYILTSSDVAEYLQNLKPFSDHATKPLVSIPEAFEEASTSESACRELIPEFYCMPEILKNVEMPKWAESPTEFVYKNRKALESTHVSRNLHHWIDLVWGTRQRGPEAEISFNQFNKELYDNPANLDDPHLPDLLRRCGTVPHQIFTFRHPARLLDNSSAPFLTGPVAVQIQASDIMYAKVRSRAPYKYDIICIDRHGEIVSNQFSFTHDQRPTRSSSNTCELTLPSSGSTDRVKPQVVRTMTHSESLRGGRIRVNSPSPNPDGKRVSVTHAKTVLSCFSEFEFTSQTTPNYFASLADSVVIVDGHKSHMAVVNVQTGAERKIKVANSDILCLAEDNGWLVTAGKDAVVNIFKGELNKPIYSIALYRDQIMCCSVSEKFQLIASGTRDGHLILSSMNRGSAVRVIDLGECRPYTVTITESWGFIVVAATKIERGKVVHVISAYNVNGEFIRQREMQTGMTAWTTWTSPDGFDYMMVTTEKGRVLWFEVYFLDFQEIDYRPSTHVVAMYYSSSDRGLVIVGCSGTITFVPFTQDH